MTDASSSARLVVDDCRMGKSLGQERGKGPGC
jgi:hypothetical protein